MPVTIGSSKRARFACLLRASPQQDDFESVEQYEQVEAYRHILDVEQIVTKFFFGLLDRASILVANLGPARYPRPNSVPQVVVRDFSIEPLHKFGPFGPRANKVHVSD